MEKTMKFEIIKRRLIIFATIILVLSMAMFFISCDGDEIKAVKWDTEIINGADYDTVEYGTEYILPEIYGLAEDGKPVNPKVNVTTPSGKKVDASFGIISVNEAGKWKVVCSCNGISNFVYNIICEDTVKPVIKILNSPSDILKGQDYPIVEFSYNDLAGIDLNSISYGLFYRQGNEEIEVDYDSFTGYFTVENYGWYVFRTTVKDNNGNQSEGEKELFVKNHEWVDESIPENYIATYGSEDYINSVAKTKIIYWDSINSETWLPTHHGKDGVVKVSMTYNNTLTGQVSAKIRFPVKDFKREDIEGIKIVYRIEQEFDSANLLYFHFDQERDIPCGQSPVIKTSKADESVNDGYWQELVLSNNQLSAFENEEGFIEGLQIGLSRGSENASFTADLYLAEIVIYKKLQTPKNLKIVDGNITWDAVENATAYRVEDKNGNSVIVSENNISASAYSGKVNVYAISDNVIYLESDAATTVNVDVPEGYLAAFDSSDYEGIAVLSTNGVLDSKIVSQTYLSEYLGEESVLKLELYAAPNYAGMLDHFAPIIIKLPKGYTNGYTIKVCAENVSDGSFGFAKDDAWNNYYYTFNTLADNEWKTVYVNTEGAGDTVYISWIYPNTEFNLEGRTINIYLSFIKDADAREINLADGYLAAFDSDVYEGVASISTTAVPGSELKSQKYLSEYLREKDVFKIELYAAPNTSGMLDQFATAVVKLPKGYTDAGYTIKMCAENVSNGTFGLAKDEGWNNYYYTFNALADNEWKTVYVDTDSSGDTVYISWIYPNTEFNLEGKTINIYLSFVKDGDARETGIYEGEGDGSVYQPESPFNNN